MRSRSQNVTLIGLVLAAAFAVCGWSSSSRASQSQAAAGGDAALAEPLRRSLAVYKGLTSYADTGTTVQESPGVTTYGEFTTYFRRKTHDFYFDYAMPYQENPKDHARLNFSNARYVWWMRNGVLETYQFEGREHRTYPPTSNQVAALIAPRTKGASVLIPGLLYSNSRLPSALLQFEQSSDVGVENQDGHPCHKIVGIAAEYYPSGQRTNVRQVTVWIDRDSLLVRRVFEDTPKGYGADSFNRLTTTLRPQANPDLPDTKFVFRVPDPQQR